MAECFANIDELIAEIGESEVKRLFEEYMLRLLYGDKADERFADRLSAYNTETDFATDNTMSDEMLLIGECESTDAMYVIEK